MSSFELLKKERLSNPRDFVNLNRWGRRQATAHFTVMVAQNGLDIPRLGITASRKTGNSVIRNKVKRFLREFFRLHKASFPQGYDILIVTKKGAGSLDYRKVKEELGALVLDKRSCIFS